MCILHHINVIIIMFILHHNIIHIIAIIVIVAIASQVNVDPIARQRQTQAIMSIM